MHNGLKCRHQLDGCSRPRCWPCSCSSLSERLELATEKIFIYNHNVLNRNLQSNIIQCFQYSHKTNLATISQIIVHIIVFQLLKLFGKLLKAPIPHRHKSKGKYVNGDAREGRIEKLQF